MKRIKTSNLLVIIVILLLFSYMVGIVIASYSILKKHKDNEIQGIDFLTATNAMTLPPFSTIVVSGQNSIQIRQDTSYKMGSSSHSVSYKIKNDTLWINCDATIGVPELKSILAKDRSVVYAMINTSCLHIQSGDKATIVIKDSKIDNLLVKSYDNSKIVVSNTPIHKVNLQLMEHSKAKLLTTIDTLTGYTESRSSLTISEVKVKDIETNGSLTIMKLTHSTSPFQIEIENQ